MLEFLGLQVSRLIRTGYGPFALGDLPRGAVVEIPPKEVERFVGGLKLPAVSTASPPTPPPSRRRPEASSRGFRK